MKKQNVLVFIFVLFQFTQAQAQAQAQVQELCCLHADNKEAQELVVSVDKMKAILDEEIRLFTNYLSQNIEYPKRAKYKMLEGNMIVHIIYDNGFDSIEITKSIDPEIDEMVLDNIREYIKNFDRDYQGAPRLAFDLPLNFRMEYW